MKLGQAVKMALRSILAKKGRSFLTMLGIIIGIASVMTIVSVVNGSNQQTMKYYEAMGTNRVQASAYLYSGESAYERIYDFCQRMGDIVVGVTPNSGYWGTVKYGAKNSTSMDWQSRPNVYFGSDQYAACNNFTLAAGRDISQLDIEDYHQVCVLGAKAAKVFFDYSNPLGEKIVVDGVPFQVIGIYAEKDAEREYSLDNVIILPYTSARFLNNYQQISECVIKVKDSKSINEVVSRVQDYLNSLTEGQTIGNGWVYSDQQWMDMENQGLAFLSLVLGGIAGISLLVGGIGIMNIMLVTVTERTREIGIRRAIGAERSSIVAQFLIESAMICGVGGIIGVAIGYLGTNIAGKLIFQGMSILPSPTITVGAFAFSVALGIIFGMYPAIKASGLQPVVALRAE